MTCIHKKGRSVIDYVIFLLNKIDNVEINEDNKRNSNHCPIIVTLNIDTPLRKLLAQYNQSSSL
jgi:hypothetical protein